MLDPVGTVSLLPLLSLHITTMFTRYYHDITAITSSWSIVLGLRKAAEVTCFPAHLREGAQGTHLGTVV